MRLALELDCDRLAPGATVRGVVRALEGGSPRSIAVTLAFCESGGPFTHVAWHTRAELIHGADVTEGWSAPFALVLLADARPGCRSANGELWWQVEARADRTLRDAVQVCRVEVASG